MMRAKDGIADVFVQQFWLDYDGMYDKLQADAEEWADLVLTRHAHELAEKIRAELPPKRGLLSRLFLRKKNTAQHAADLIDPAVQDENWMLN